MNRIQVSLNRSRGVRAIGWRSGWRSGSISGLAVAFGLVLVTGCSDNSNPPSDMASPGHDLLTTLPDGGMIKTQQPGCSQDDWCWMFPQPQGNTLRSVWGSSATDAWAVGDSGTLLHYTGSAWKSVLSPSSSPLFAVWGSGPSDVYAVGDRATVLHYDGSNWTSMMVSGDSLGSAALYGIWGSGSDDVWIVGAGGTVLHKTGGTLTKITQAATGQLLLSVFGASGKIYAVGTSGTLLKYDGTTFSTLNIAGSETLTSVVGTSAGDLFVGSLNGSIRHSTDATTFAQVNLCTTAPTGDPTYGCRLFNGFGVNAMAVQGSDVYAVGDLLYTNANDPTHRHGIIKKWDGTQFQEVAGAPPVTYYGVFSSSSSNLFAVGASGTIVQYDGSAFTSSSPVDLLTGVSNGMAGVSGSANSDLYAVGDWGATLKWNGSAWSSITTTAYTRFRAISGSSNNMFSLAFDEMAKQMLILQFSSSSWTPQTFAPTTTALFSVWSSGEEAVALGAGDTILRRDTTAGSATYHQWIVRAVNPPVGTTLRGAWGTSVQNLFIVGGGDSTDAHVYPGKVLTFNGATANEVADLPVSDSLFAIWGADATHVFAVGDNGAIIATTDGSTWTKQDGGTMFNLRGVWGTSATNVYAVGVGGIILHFDGQAWKMMASGTTVAFSNIWGVGKDAYIAGSNGTVLHLTIP